MKKFSIFAGERTGELDLVIQVQGGMVAAVDLDENSIIEKGTLNVQIIDLDVPKEDLELEVHCFGEAGKQEGREEISIRWTIEDIHSLRKEKEMTKLSDSEAEKFLRMVKNQVIEESILKGWEILEDVMETEKSL